jgi:hypothetical protein
MPGPDGTTSINGIDITKLQSDVTQEKKDVATLNDAYSRHMLGHQNQQLTNRLFNNVVAGEDRIATDISTILSSLNTQQAKTDFIARVFRYLGAQLDSDTLNDVTRKLQTSGGGPAAAQKVSYNPEDLVSARSYSV